jgi:Leucine-rich repeat (LRR) protein
MRVLELSNRHINHKGDELLRLNLHDSNIDELINFPKAKELHITGLNQKDFDRFIDEYANNYEFINFFKCPGLRDLTRLSTLKTLKYLSFYYNNKSDKLWDLSMNTSLRGLSLIDFRKITNLNELSISKSLKELHIALGTLDRKAEIDSLNPIGQIKNLQYLSMYGFNIKDNDPTPLFNLKNLKELTLPHNYYEMEFYAKLAVKIPKVKCDCFKGYVEVDDWGDGRTVSVVGKDGPKLKPTSEKLKLYLQQFEEAKRKSRNP